MIKYHFLNVGHGDTTIIELPNNKLMVVDFNRDSDFDEDTAKEICEVYKGNYNEMKNSGSYYSYLKKYYDIALDDPLEYMTQNFSENEILRYIQTHPHADHFAGFKELTKIFTIKNFWDTDHKNTTITTFHTDSDKEDWETYLEYRKDKKKIFYRSEKAKIDSEEYKIYVFHPTIEALKEGDVKDNPKPNFFSYLLLIEHKGIKTVLGGDVENKYWKDLWDWLEKNPSVKDIFKGIHIFKASHHGRKSGRCGWEEEGIFNRDFLNWMNPEYVIISVGKKPENCDATEWYRKRPNDTTRNVLTTRWYGTIWLEGKDDGNIILDTRYDRKDKNDHIQKLSDPFSNKNNYEFKIAAKRSTVEAGPFVEEYKSKGRKLSKNMWLKFYIKKTNIPEPFNIKWRVVNTGFEARNAGQERGKIENDDGTKTKKEHTAYKGTHYVDCFAIKNNECVAEDRFYVNIK